MNGRRRGGCFHSLVLQLRDSVLGRLWRDSASPPIQPLPCLFARVMIGVLVIRRRSTLDIQMSWTERLCGDDKQQFLEKRLSTLEIFLSTSLSQAQQNRNTLLSLWWGRWQSKHPFDAIEWLHINSPSPAETHSVEVILNNPRKDLEKTCSCWIT